MKFDKKYPDKTDPRKLWPDKLMGPHREISVTLLITQTWRIYACHVCDALTGWRYETTPCCSEECCDQMKADDLASETVTAA